jgi:transcriptional regulator with XRE-family HTH domain
MNISPEKLIHLRKDRGWSQEKLAAISGISERTIQRAESDGSCSLDTKLAFATVFEIPPSELSAEAETGLEVGKIVYRTDWGGALGLLVLGLVTAAIVLITGTNGPWEGVSITVVWGLTITISVISHGAKSTYRLFDNTSWIVRYPSYTPNLNNYISHAKTVMENSYIVGISASLVAALTLALHTDIPQESFPRFLAVSIKPLIYSMLLSELWFRPYKRKMERMLQSQSEKI